uniref:Uncharacterized protein n=1 Tax=Arundo donax TaxID=35708 RepID=A0A0A9EUQ8_ARUDO
MLAIALPSKPLVIHRGPDTLTLPLKYNFLLDSCFQHQHWQYHLNALLGQDQPYLHRRTHHLSPLTTCPVRFSQDGFHPLLADCQQKFASPQPAGSSSARCCSGTA